MDHQPPSGFDRSISLAEDSVYVFTLADFPFTDPDGDSLYEVRITTAPGLGTILKDGAGLTAPFITAAEIAAGRITYVPAADGFGAPYTTFTFQVNDDGWKDNGAAIVEDPTPNTFTINVTPVDDPPVAVADSGATGALSSVSLDLLANDVDIDGGPIALTTIAGVAVGVGDIVVLPSGARATVTSAGTILYDPNGRFDDLISPETAAATGAVNSMRLDGFSYSLNGGSAAGVAIRVDGVDGPGDILRGDSGNNVIVDTVGMGRLWGGEGADELYGSDGADVIMGGPGSDIIAGGGDTPNELYGGPGNDRYLVAHPGDTIVELIGEGTDIIETSLAAYALGANLENLIFTGTGSAVLVGNSLANRITGGSSNDELIGGSGDDVYDTTPGDTVVELPGEGIDSVVTSENAYFLRSNIENLFFAGAGSAVLVGNELDNLIVGGAGNDELIGGTGKDTYMATAQDTIVESAGEGIDQVLTAENSYVLRAANVENLIFNGSGGAMLTGSAGDNIIIGAAGADLLSGLDGSDYLIGLDGDDVLAGGAGVANQLQGGGGNDTYLVDAAGDTIVEFFDEGRDSVRTAIPIYVLQANIEDLIFTGISSAVLVGNALSNHIAGGPGDDEMIGGDGDDTYVTTLGDTIVELDGEGNDTIETVSNDYSLVVPNIENVTFIGSGPARLEGNAADNRLVGGLDADTLIGLAGNDLLFGGSGERNVLIGGSGDDTYYLSAFFPNGFEPWDTVVELDGEGIDALVSSGDGTLPANVENLFLVGTRSEFLFRYNGNGNDLDNYIVGSTVDDRLNGGPGSDTLVGNGGSDMFIFNSPIGQGNVDTILDFDLASDLFLLSRSVFPGLTETGHPGHLSPSQFRFASDANSPDVRIIFDDATGAILFDPDGNGPIPAIHFATISGEHLGPSNFHVI